MENIKIVNKALTSHPFRYTKEIVNLENEDIEILTPIIFKECKIGGIILPNVLKKIQDNAFESCNIEKIFIPKSVTYIAPFAFKNCTNLKEITFENGIYLKKLGFACFDTCKSLENITLPKSLTSFEFGWFYKTNVKTIEIPENVKEIFLQDYQYTNIKNVIYSGNNNLIKDVLKNAGFAVFESKLDAMLSENKSFKEINKVIKENER